jgi:predicted permease
MKKFFIGVLFLLGILILAVLSFIQPSPKNQYEDGTFLLQNQKAIKNLSFENVANSEYFQAAWAKVSLVPPFSTTIAIDDHRGGKHFEGVRDTVYSRSIVLQNGDKKVAIVSADLLIIPPIVAEILDTLLMAEGFSLENIYLSATHTHSSIGGWQNSYVGEIFAGTYDERVPLFIAEKIAHCMDGAVVVESAIYNFKF